MYKSPDGVISNAFFCTIRDLFIDGNRDAQAIGDWHSAFNCTTNPYLSTATYDPNFDLQHQFDNLFVQAASGEGFYFHSRGEIGIDGAYAFNNQGTGFILPFDTELTKCRSGFNLLGGFVLPQGDTHLGVCHSFNNGGAPQFNSLFVEGSGTSWILSNQYNVQNGTFTITVPAGTTSSIAWNASAATVAAAVSAIAGFSGTCTGTSGPLGG